MAGYPWCFLRGDANHGLRACGIARAGVRDDLYRLYIVGMQSVKLTFGPHLLPVYVNQGLATTEDLDGSVLG